MGQIIKGKPVADAITAELQKDVEALKAQGITPKLKIVRVGAREDDLAYERGALSRMEKCGIAAEVLELPVDIEQADFVKALKAVNDDPAVHGILLFRPLPKQLDMEEIKFVVDAVKDIDCMNPLNAEKIFEGDKTGYPPCTSQACVEILDHYGVELKGKNVAVVGRSMVVIAAVGRAEMVKGDFINEGTVVIDVGINVNAEGKLCGDVKFDECVEKASMITPVPAGVGSVTTSVLAKHVVKACKQLNGIK